MELAVLKRSHFLNVFYPILFLFVSNSDAQNSRSARKAEQLRLCPSFSGPVAQFCNVNIMDQLCVNGNVVPGGFGNTLIVDQVNGSDTDTTRGAVNGPAFKTISAALAQAQPGDLVWVFPGVYNEAIVIPPGVILEGVAINSVIVQQLDVTAATTLITIGEGATISQINGLLTSSMHVPLRGIEHNTGIVAEASTYIIECIITVDNSGAGAGTSDVYGFYSTGSGSTEIPDYLVETIIEVFSTGDGAKRGIYIDSPTLQEIIFSLLLATGGTDVIGAEINNPDGIFIAQNGELAGDTADISQTAGSLQLSSVYLAHSTANALGFDAQEYPTYFSWADQNSLIGGGQTFYMGPATSLYTPIYTEAFQKFVAFILKVRVETPPGVGQSTTWTLQKNGIDTPLTVTLSGTEMSATLTGVSDNFSAGDLISMKMVTSAGALTGGAGVTVAIY